MPDRPVFLYAGGTGPAVVNSLGQAFFESITDTDFPVVVGAEGAVTGPNANRALYHLRLRQTFADKVRSALDAQAYSASVGTTTVLDQTLPPPNTFVAATGTFDLSLLDPQPTHALFNLNHYRMYDGWLAAHRDGVNIIRLQINFLHNQGFFAALGGLENQLPELRERLRNQFPFFGNEWVRTGGIGEWAAPFALESANPDGYAVWREAQRLVAQARWRNENAQAGSKTNPANIDQVVRVYEECDADFGIKDLRWGLQHADFATEDQLARLKALNVAVSVSGHRWLGGQPSTDGLPNGTMFDRIKASGIRWALHQDGVHIATHNPFFALHYAITGLNVAGVDINAGQRLTRQEALYAYTRGSSWYLNRENELGSIEARQVRRPGRARQGLLQGERRRGAPDPPDPHRRQRRDRARHRCPTWTPLTAATGRGQRWASVTSSAGWSVVSAMPTRRGSRGPVSCGCHELDGAVGVGCVAGRQAGPQVDEVEVTGDDDRALKRARHDREEVSALGQGDQRIRVREVGRTNGTTARRGRAEPGAGLGTGRVLGGIDPSTRDGPRFPEGVTTGRCRTARRRGRERARRCAGRSPAGTRRPCARIPGF